MLRRAVRESNRRERCTARLEVVSRSTPVACDKGLHAAYERNHHPAEKVHQPWIDDCMAQMKTALAAVEAMVDSAKPYLLLGRLTQADITAFIAECLAGRVPRSPVAGGIRAARAAASFRFLLGFERRSPSNLPPALVFLATTQRVGFSPRGGNGP